MNPHILVSGYYGFGNAGDEAILSSLLADLRDLRPGAKVTVVSGNPRDTELEYGVDAIHWQDVSETARAAKDTDFMVLGGGGLFQDHWPPRPEHILTPRHANIDNWTGFALLARLTDTPLMIYGVGVGPLSTVKGRDYTRLAFAQAAAISVRDDASLSLLRDAGVDRTDVVVSTDPAYLLEVVPHQPAPLGPTIAVALRPWGEHPTRAGWVTETAAGLDAVIERLGVDLTFIPFQRSVAPIENDGALAAAICKRMQHIDRTTILRGDYGPSEIAGLLAGAELVVGMRLHSIELAAVSSTPVVALGYDPKVGRAMHDLGLDDLTIELTDLTSQRLADTIVSTFERRNEIKSQMGGRLSSIRQNARRNTRLLADFLDGRLAPPPLENETIDAIRTVTLDRVIENSTLENDAPSLRDRLSETTARLEQEQQLVEITQDRFNELWNSKAMRLTRSYWTARGYAESAVRRVRGKNTGEQEEDALDTVALAEAREGSQGELDRILGRHEDAPGFVIFPPGIGWAVTLFQRPQQMALAFARMGYVVIYNLRANNAERVRGFREYLPRMYLAQVPDQAIDVLTRVPHPLVITYVYNFDWSRNLPDAVTVYDHIDELEVFTAAYSLADLGRWHDDAVLHADLVTGSARDLHSHLLERRPDAMLLPNGVDYGHFAYYRPGDDTPEDLEPILEIGRPIIGYYGALAEWLDYDLIRHSTQQLPDHEFVFIGPDYDGTLGRSRILDLPNVTWLGPKPYAELPAYLERFDVATIPFQVSDVTHSVSPLKLFEYMAGGKPIVIPDLREAGGYPGVLVSHDAGEYVQRLRDAVALRDDAGYATRMRRTARNNTWDQRVLTLADAADRAIR
ncbi:MAG: polysaccharide pyruvyl transferase family protein [Acidimicrobiia bacterium]